MTTQAANLHRVRHRLHDVILRFVSERLAAGVREFHAADLHSYVAEFTTAAPGSADRILRDMKRSGLVDYRVLNRAASLYQLLPLTYTQQRLFA